VPKIFISYRRNDSQAVAGRLFDRLCAHYGRAAVVMDTDSIPLGADFNRYIAEAVRRCQVVLVVIGEHWEGQAGGGESRLEDPADVVRLEIETALAADVTLIPLPIGARPMPSPQHLPASIRELASRNALRIDPGQDFHHHVNRLQKELDGFFGTAAQGASQEGGILDHPVKTGDANYPLLELTSGPDKGRTVHLEHDRILIGRDQDCNVVVDASFVSKHHAQLVKTGDGYSIEDLRSANGTYVNGKIVRERVPLSDRDRIHVGQAILIFRTSPASED
jgi:FHA domain/TIR domain